jgi:hypothetical protein
MWPGYQLDDSGFKSQPDQGIYLFSKTSGSDLWPTQSPIQWVPRAFSQWVKWPGIKLTIHLHLERSLKTNAAIPPLHPHAFMASTGQLYCCYLLTIFSCIAQKSNQMHFLLLTQDVLCILVRWGTHILNNITQWSLSITHYNLPFKCLYEPLM